MEYEGRYWRRIIPEKEVREPPVKFTVQAGSNKEAIEKALDFIMFDAECTTTAMVENPQLLVGDKWVNLD
jgi:hypothetical protein